jgi:stage IV sporulation protein FB
MEFDPYPEKPALPEEKAKNNLAATIFSVVLFILTFLFIFSDEVNFIFHLVIVLLVHELGHFTMMKLFNYQHVRMLFVPLMGAFVQGSKEIYSQRQSLLVVGTGPFPGILIGAILIFSAGSTHMNWMLELGLLFLFLNMLNLLPLDPLDGGQLFKLLIYRNQDLFLLLFSFISSLILIGFGWYTQSWLVIGFGFVMGFRVRGLQRQYYLRKRLDSEGVIYEAVYKSLSNSDYHKIKNVILEDNDRMSQYTELMDQEEVDQIMAQRVNGVLKSPVAKDAGLLFKSVLIFCWISLIISPFFLLVFGNDWIKEHYSWYFEYLSVK